MSFIGDYPFKQKDLLKRIRVKWWDDEMWRYDFSYEIGTGIGTSDYYNRLSSVTFTCGDLHYNPTRIVWGERPEISHPYGTPDNDDYSTRIHLNGTFNGVSVLSDNMKFPGDFNGDGLTDFISVKNIPVTKDSINSDPTDAIENTGFLSMVRVYLNRGNTKTETAGGIIDFDTVYRVSMTQNELVPGTSSPTIFNYVTGLKWVYVCDINGDGLDDFILHRKLDNVVLIHVFKSELDDNNILSFSKAHFFGTSTIPYLYDNQNSNEENLLIGDFMGRGRQDMILVPARYTNNNPRKFIYFSFVETNGVEFISIEEAGCGMRGTYFVTGDYNGDGRTEIWYGFDEPGNTGMIVRIFRDAEDNYKYKWGPFKGGFLSTNHTLFTGDFNGDGKTDFLSYNKSTNGW